MGMKHYIVKVSADPRYDQYCIFGDGGLTKKINYASRFNSHKEAIKFLDHYQLSEYPYVIIECRDNNNISGY